MRYDILRRYRSEIEQGKLDELIYQNYSLDFDKNIYYIVKKDGSLLNVTNESDVELKEWIKVRDIYSGYLNSNRALQKKIMSNNYLSLFIKIKQFKDIDANVLNYYFNKIEELNTIVVNSKAAKKPTKKQRLYLDLNVYNKELFIESSNRLKSAVEQCQILYDKKNIEPQIYKDMENIKVKFFYDADYKFYEEEIKKYLSFKLYKDSQLLGKKRIIEDEDKLYIVSEIDMNLNSKKRTLVNTSMNVKSTYVTLEDSIYLYKIDRLLRYIGKFNSGFYEVTLPNSMNSKLEDLVLANTEIDKITVTEKGVFNLDKTGKLELLGNYIIQDKPENITLKNYLKLKELVEGTKNEYHIKSDENNVSIYRILKRLEKISGCYNTQEEKKTDILGFSYAYEMLESNTFNKYYERLIYAVINKLLEVNKDIENKIKELLNIYLSLYFYYEKGEKMNMEKIKEELLNKLENNILLESDEEFLFLYGQLYRFIINHSETSKKTFDLVDMPVKTRNEKILKERLYEAYSIYKHAFSLNDKWFNNACSMVLSYEMKDKKILLKNYPLLVGLTYDNLFYTKRNKNTEDKEI